MNRDCTHPLRTTRSFYFWSALIGLCLWSSHSLANLNCVSVFTTDKISIDHLYTNPREELDIYGGLLKIGEGNSGSVYLFKTASGDYQVAKIYKVEEPSPTNPKPIDKLKRDHEGLAYVQNLFNLDSRHSINFKVNTSEIVDNFNGVSGQRALVMPFVPGINLHDLLINTPKGHPDHIKVEALYNQFIKELDEIARSLHIYDEFLPESVRYFQDHIVDGLLVLSIQSKPRILIKTDNIIFNPADNSLTLIDPF